MIPLRPRVFQLHTGKRIGRQLHPKHGEDIRREQRPRAAEVRSGRALGRLPCHGIGTHASHILIAPRVDRFRGENVQPLAIDLGEPRLATAVHVIELCALRFAAQTDFQFRHIGHQPTQPVSWIFPKNPLSGLCEFPIIGFHASFRLSPADRGALLELAN